MGHTRMSFATTAWEIKLSGINATLVALNIGGSKFGPSSSSDMILGSTASVGLCCENEPVVICECYKRERLRSEMQ